MAKGVVQIKVSTWSRDSHGLYDYDSRDVHTLSHSTSSKCMIISEYGQVRIVPFSDATPEPGIKVLAQLRRVEGQFIITGGWGKWESGEKMQQREKLWIIVKSIKGSCYKLSEGDLIRLGRVVYGIRKIGSEATLSDKTKPISVKSISEGGLNTADVIWRQEAPFPVTIAEGETNSEGETISEQCCRICFCNNFTKEDPLISICACTGSVQFIHVNCLQQWLGTKLSKKETEHCRSYQWKSLKWELCKDVFPSAIELHGQKSWLIDIPTPETGFLVLETLPETQTESRSLHAISLQNRAKLNLGRAHESDIRVSDISVSRKHAMIKSKKGGLYIEDNASKFGTLVRTKRPILLQASSSISLQVGRSVIRFEYRKPWSCLSCLPICRGTDVPEDETVQALSEREPSGVFSPQEVLSDSNSLSFEYNDQDQIIEEQKSQILSQESSHPLVENQVIVQGFIEPSPNDIIPESATYRGEPEEALANESFENRDEAAESEIHETNEDREEEPDSEALETENREDEDIDIHDLIENNEEEEDSDAHDSNVNREEASIIEARETVENMEEVADSNAHDTNSIN